MTPESTETSSPIESEQTRDGRSATVLAEVDALQADGKLLEAIDVLSAANREQRDTEIERRLVRLRHDAFPLLNGSKSRPRAPKFEQVELPVSDGLPAVAPDELTAQVLYSGIRQAGCLLIRGFVSQSRVEGFVEGIDRAFESREAHSAGTPSSETTPWFEPFDVGPSSLQRGRHFVRDSGGMLVPDSPRVTFDLLETFEQVGLREPATAFLGERPALSINKWTLRRVSPEAGTDWHQDGAFLGGHIRALNVWLSLSHCGRDAPGLDIVPRRLDEVVETGTEGAIFPWAVAPAMVDTAAAGTQIARPIFEPGDALLFDHLFLHRTASGPEMTKDRYAIESWFFAPSAYPDRKKHVPLVF
jgi:hypothetical protein